MLMQRLAVVLALAHAAARPVGPRALPRKAVEQRKAGERRAGWTAKLKFLRDDWPCCSVRQGEHHGEALQQHVLEVLLATCRTSEAEFCVLLFS